MRRTSARYLSKELEWYIGDAIGKHEEYRELIITRANGYSICVCVPIVY